MKITYTTAVRCLLFLAACLPAAAQVNVNPNHSSDGSSAETSASTQEAQIKALQRQLESYEQQLRAKAERVEEARQQAISAGIVGDGAGPIIDAYQQELKQLEELQAALDPQVERTRAMIANLTMPAPPSDTALSSHTTTARPARTVAAPGDLGGGKQDKARSTASNNSSKLNPAAK